MQNHMYVFPARKFQIQTPGSTTFTCISWMLNRGYVAVGGSDGALRVMLLNLDQDKSNPPSSLNPWLSSQQLEGHSSSVRVLSWNEVYQKLASTDDAGVIIVWMTHGPDESWFEEMVNNRQKSTVSSLKWSNDGMKIAIAYEDGQVIIGSVDGNRLWNKDIGGSLTKIAWNTDDTLLLLGFADGEVHAYSQYGDFVSKVKMLCVENMELETALSKDLKKDVIVSMEWYVPPHSSKIVTNVGGGQSLTQQYRNADTSYNLTGDESYNTASRLKVPEGRPPFLVAYQNGNIQLMCNENISKGVSIVRLPSTLIIMAQWSPDGSMFAVAGLQLDLPETERNVLHFISAYGERLQSIRLAPGHFAGIAWESSGHRLGALIDTNIYLVVIKFPYRWTYCGQTLVFAYKTLDSLQEVLVFYETKMEVKTKRYVQNLCSLKSYGDYCVTIFRTEELRGAYTMQLCDSIGTPVDSHTTNVPCSVVAMNASVVIVASTESFIVWHYSVPRQENTTTVSIGFQKTGNTNRNIPTDQNDKVHYIDEHRTEKQQQPTNGVTTDPICAIAASANFFLIACESGILYRFSLPNVQLQSTFKSNIPAPKLMTINCDGSRLALIGKYNVLRLIDLPKENIFTPILTFERREVWSVEWDDAKNDLLALMEKQRLVIVRGTETDEPIPHIGRICQFKDLVVRLVLLDDIFKEPDRVSRHSFVEIEIKILKTIKSTLESDKLQDAIALIEKGNHPKLWNILAKDALKRLDLRTAEHAFVKLQDYGGILFLKRLQNIHSDSLKRAEVSVFLGDLETAEKIYFENDRRDLAIDMLKKMHDWFRIQQILQTSNGPGDDALAQQTWQHTQIDPTGISLKVKHRHEKSNILCAL
uniref:Anaphase-promoting complex subunit 4-like WD40 domain-containing protein n=2 Tax=Meloidogyne TaxID=189290 RepID=A0A914MD46_MELIC